VIVRGREREEGGNSKGKFHAGLGPSGTSSKNKLQDMGYLVLERKERKKAAKRGKKGGGSKERVVFIS